MVPLSNKEYGNWGEEMAVAHLLSLGYAIRERQWRLHHFEVDIIAQDGNAIVFVEVKARQNLDADPVEAVNARKRAKLVASANAYLQRFSLPFEYRFDIIAITGNASNYTLTHIPDAFFPSLKHPSSKFRM